MDQIKFKDFCKNFIEEVNPLISAEKISLLRFLTVLKAFKRFFVLKDFIIFVSFDQASFGNEIKHFIATIAKKTN